MTEPTDIRSILIELADGFGIANAAETVRLFSAWERIVGPQVASRCEPVMLKEGVLKVRASSPAWAAELRFLGPQIARRVNEELGRDVVREVKAQGPPASSDRGPSKPGYRRSGSKRSPRGKGNPSRG